MDNGGRTTGRKMRCRRLANLNDDIEITLKKRYTKTPTRASAQAAEPRTECTEPRAAPSVIVFECGMLACSISISLCTDEWVIHCWMNHTHESSKWNPEVMSYLFIERNVSRAYVRGAFLELRAGQHPYKSTSTRLLRSILLSSFTVYSMNLYSQLLTSIIFHLPSIIYHLPVSK